MTVNKNNNKHFKKWVWYVCKRNIIIVVFQAHSLQQQQDKERRERSDTISKLLGDYLLKGYKMLGSTCGECDVSINLFIKCTCL